MQGQEFSKPFSQGLKKLDIRNVTPDRRLFSAMSSLNNIYRGNARDFDKKKKYYEKSYRGQVYSTSVPSFPNFGGYGSSVEYERSACTPLQCTFCAKFFTTICLLVKHSKMNRYRCQKCRKCFIEENCYQTHPCERDAPYKCNGCSKWFKLKEKLECHACERNVYQCGVCSQSFTSKFEFSWHDCNAKNISQCSLCLQCFTTRENFMGHICGTRVYQCGVCGQWCMSQELFMSHRCQSKNLIQCKTCLEYFRTDQDLLVHNANSRYKCNLCSQCFTSEHESIMHAVSSSGEMFYPCQFCPHSSATIQLFKAHSEIHANLDAMIAISHEEEKVYTCRACKDSFGRSIDLQLHFTKMHSTALSENYASKFLSPVQPKRDILEPPSIDPLKYMCKFCPELFVMRVDLLTHFIDTHAGDTPYPCHYCLQYFKNNSELQVHIRSHLGKKPHKCSICTERFESVAGLLIHKKDHSYNKLYTCKLCSFKSSNRRDLIRHVVADCQDRIRSNGVRKGGLANFTTVGSLYCRQCWKRFSCSSDLKGHREKARMGPNKCEVCYDFFESGCELELHMMRTTHGKKYRDLMYLRRVGRERGSREDVPELMEVFPFDM